MIILKPAVVADRSKATISTDCSQQRTQVRIPLEAKMYMVAICTSYNWEMTMLKPNDQEAVINGQPLFNL